MSLNCLAPLLLAQAVAANAPADTGCQASLPDRPAPAATAATKADPAFFDQKADARAAMDGALADAAQSGRSAVLVFGADWCHDSVALAALLSSDAFKTEFGKAYSVTFIDVGVPQTGKGRNIERLARFKVRQLKGTPAMFVVSPDGRQRNTTKDALSWRNAESRGAAATLAWFRELKP